nr:MAG TPA: type I neck protein [Caudoviricetes sp.]
MKKAGAGKEFEKEVAVFLEALADEFLIYVQNYIIRLGNVDTRLLLNSFQKNSEGNVYTLSDGGFEIEVGTNVKYASYVNNGHLLNPKGVSTRFVPGRWNGDSFIYDPNAKTGMLLKQRRIEGSHYFDKAINLIEKTAPQFMEKKLQQWADKYFSDFI